MRNSAVRLTARLALAVVAALLLASLMPALFGWRSHVVMSDSMMPALRPGDVVVAASIPPGAIRPGQVLVFADSDTRDLLVHRVVSTSPNGLVTRGDANATNDGASLPIGSVRGAVRWRIPMAGLLAYHMSRHHWGGTALLLGALVAIGHLATLPIRSPRARHRVGPQPHRTDRRLLRRAWLASRGLPPRTAGAASALTALIVVAATAHTSNAAFTASTGSPNNLFAAGTVALGDDDGGNSATTGTAMFTVDNVIPGDEFVECVTVTYTGDVPASVRLYAVSSSGALAAYLTLTVEEGIGGRFGDCTGFTSATTIFSATEPVAGSGTLDAMTSTRTSHATGLGNFSPVGTTTESRTYRFKVAVRADDAAAGHNALTTLVWEARS